MCAPRLGLLAFSLIVVCAASAQLTNPFGGDPGLTLRRLSTPERLRITRLKATHDDLGRLRATHRPLPTAAGFVDLRAVIHAHSSLSHDSKGTLEGMVKGAKEAGVSVIMTSEHPAKDRDVLALGLRGMHSGVLFIPGTEEQNLLTYPTILKHDPSIPQGERIRFVALQTLGLVFIAHPEEIKDWPGLGEFYTGMEIYNTHADLKDEPELQRMLTRDLDLESLIKLFEAFKFLPVESFACIQDAPTAILKRWDELTQYRRIVGIAANDSHENTRFVVKKKSDTHVEIYDFYDQLRATVDARRVPVFIPALKLLGEQNVGDKLMTATLDPYERSFHYVNTHILARDHTEPSVRAALSAGHCYVSFDWMGDPTGTFFNATDGRQAVMMGDEIRYAPGLALEFGTTLEATYRVIQDGKVMLYGTGRSAHIPVTRPGVYRVEFWEQLAGEDRPWLYTNPIYVR